MKVTYTLSREEIVDAISRRVGNNSVLVNPEITFTDSDYNVLKCNDTIQAVVEYDTYNPVEVGVTSVSY